MVEAAQNPLLTKIMVTLLKATIQVYAEARRRSLSNLPNVLQFVHEHKQIINAIAQQEAELAAMLMAQHVDDARKRIEGVEG
ncbi:MAG: FCD domain-containing protein [Anaerolineae bacterium]